MTESIQKQGSEIKARGSGARMRSLAEKWQKAKSLSRAWYKIGIFWIVGIAATTVPQTHVFFLFLLPSLRKFQPRQSRWKSWVQPNHLCFHSLRVMLVRREERNLQDEVCQPSMACGRSVVESPRFSDVNHASKALLRYPSG